MCTKEKIWGGGGIILFISKVYVCILKIYVQVMYIFVYSEF